jgi:hypothetical protein
MGNTAISSVLKREMPAKPGKGKEVAEAVNISRLQNSIYYFIELVYISKYNDDYRLIAIHHGHILCDRLYPGLRGAKIAFVKLFKHKLWDSRAKPAWSHLYTPDSDWYRKTMPVAPPLIPFRRDEP